MLLERFVRSLMFGLILGGCLGDEDDRENESLDDSGEQQDSNEAIGIGPSVTQVDSHPYVASILKNNIYQCSAVILNNHWLITVTKCFNISGTHIYVYQRDLANFTIRVGSSYNNKGGSIYKMKMLINNIDLQISAVKAHAAIEFGPGVESANLPQADEEPSMGYLAQMVAWTPNGHLRTISAPVIQPDICEGDTELMSGQFICVGGVQDPNTPFCRKDTGGAVIQNHTLIAVTMFSHACALYSRAHAFPKISSFSLWLDTAIWDESKRPVTTTTSTTQITTTTNATTTMAPTTIPPEYVDYQENMVPDVVKLPMGPVGVPRISSYEAYLKHLKRYKSSTKPPGPSFSAADLQALLKMRKSPKMVPLPPSLLEKNFDDYDYKE